jgi:lipoyl(octanoyl) transferase
MTAWLVRPDGPVAYDAAFALMHDLAERRVRDEIPDTLMLLEHPPVYTAGRRFDPSHLRWDEDRISGTGAGFRRVDRGGSVTFHGPGQLVGYPIIDLGRRPDLAAYLSRLEEVVIRSGGDAGVPLTRDDRQAGVWSDGAKVCAIGVRLARWRVTVHGFALNCDVDLSWYDAIVPCGLTDRTVTTLSKLAGRAITTTSMAPIVTARFAEVFGCSLVAAPDEVVAELRAGAGVP